MPEKGFGATFLIGASDPASTNIADVISITPPGIEVDDINVSTMQSTGQWSEHIAGFKNAGELSITIQYNKTDAATLFALVGTDHFYKIVFTDGGNWRIAGYIKSFGQEVELEGIITTSLTIMISGVPAFATSEA